MTDTQLLLRRFAAIGATLRVGDGPWLGAPRIDVDDATGFELGFAGRGAESEAEVVAVDPADRHLQRGQEDAAAEPAPARPSIDP
jgi:hypothetical protein